MSGADSIHSFRSASNHPFKRAAPVGETTFSPKKGKGPEADAPATEIVTPKTQNRDWISRNVSLHRNTFLHPDFTRKLWQSSGDSVPAAMASFIRADTEPPDSKTARNRRSILGKDKRRNEGVIEALIETATDAPEIERLLDDTHASKQAFTKAAKKEEA